MSEEKESPLWEGAYSPRAMIGHWILAAIATIVGFVGAVVTQWWLWTLGAIGLLWVCLGVLLAYRRLNVAFELTNQRFIHRSGILRRTTDRIEVIDMDDITFVQGPIERLLGVGTIRITSSDRTHPDLLMPGIEDVHRVAGLLDDARRTERMRRGLHIEAI